MVYMFHWSVLFNISINKFPPKKEFNPITEVF